MIGKVPKMKGCFFSIKEIIMRDVRKIPDRYYYLLNGKSAMENYIEQKEKQSEDFKNSLFQKKNVNADKIIEKEIKKIAEKEIVKQIEKIFK